MMKILRPLLLTFAVAFPCFAEQPSGKGESGTIEITELPEPPVAIAELLKRVEVRFTYGLQQKPSAIALPNGRQLDALTVYKMTYDFHSQSRWAQGRSANQVVTTIRLSRDGLQSKHTVWFREHPEPETFWSNRLVLHELDHVKISSDPRLESRFKEMLKTNPMLTRQDDANKTLRLKQVNQLAEAYTEGVFSEISSLIEIRYKELDLLTDHGKFDLPEVTPLDSILRPPR